MNRSRLVPDFHPRGGPEQHWGLGSAVEAVAVVAVGGGGRRNDILGARF